MILQGLHKPLARWVCRSVQDSCGLDLHEVAPVNYIHLCNMPVLFLGVEGDTVVPPECADELFNRHPGYSELLRLSGSHNGQRTQEVVERQMAFIAKHMAVAAATAAAGRKSLSAAAAAAIASKQHAAGAAGAAASKPPAAVRVDALGGSEYELQQRFDMRKRTVSVKGIRVSLEVTPQQQPQQQQQQQEGWTLKCEAQRQQQEKEDQGLAQYPHQQQQEEEHLESQSSLCSQASSTSGLCTVTLLFEVERLKGTMDSHSSAAASTPALQQQ